MLEISPNAKISRLADIEESARGSYITIEDGVSIDSFVKIKPVGGMGAVRIGRNSDLNSGVVIYSGNGVDIGEDVLIASNCTIAPTSHEFKSRTIKIFDQGFRPNKGGIIIEDDVLIGANSVILDGAILRRGCVVGSHSLVMGELEPYSINVGNPIRNIGYRK
jgi:virginiamycin A acetyltransferase